jgi:hypothetical protein
MPTDSDWIVAVKSCQLPQGIAWYARFAHHTWIDVKHGDEGDWMRIEVLTRTSGVQTSSIPARTARADTRWQRSIRVHTLIEGPRAQRIAAVIEAQALEHNAEYALGYHGWPGPNSNTLIAELAREIPDLALSFDPNALGKDYEGWFSTGWTSSKTGVRIDSLPLGFAIGLREGVELHLIGLTIGVSFVPPRLNLPFMPALPWEERSPSLRDPKSGPVEIDYDIQLSGDVLTPGSLRREVGEFARAGKIRCSAPGSANWILIDYQLLERGAERRPRLEAAVQLHTDSQVRMQLAMITFDESGKAALQELISGELRAHVEFVRTSAGHFSGSIELERR